MKPTVTIALIDVKTDNVKIAGISAANDLATAGGTLSGILICQPFCLRGYKFLLQGKQQSYQGIFLWHQDDQDLKHLTPFFTTVGSCEEWC